MDNIVKWYMEAIKARESLRLLTERLAIPAELLKGAEVHIEVCLPERIYQKAAEDPEKTWSVFEHDGTNWQFVRQKHGQDSSGQTERAVLPWGGLMFPPHVVTHLTQGADANIMDTLLSIKEASECSEKPEEPSCTST